MGFVVNTVRDAAISFEATLEKAFGVDAKESHRRSMAKLRELISDGATSVAEAFQIVNTRLEADVKRLKKAAIAKSTEAEISANSYGRDFFTYGENYKTPPTMSQVLEAEDHQRTIDNVQAIRDAVAATGINVRIDDYSGDRRLTVNSTSAQAAAGVGAQEDIAWPMDLAPGGAGVTQAQIDADEFNASRGVSTNFSGTMGRPATTPNGTAGDGATSFAKSASFQRAQRVSERRDR